MNLSEFDVHRPSLARQLRSLLESDELTGNWEFGWNIAPQYADGIMFVAKHPIIGSLICVGPGHPKVMIESDAPGCQGTWWWKADMDCPTCGEPPPGGSPFCQDAFHKY